LSSTITCVHLSISSKVEFSLFSVTQWLKLTNKPTPPSVVLFGCFTMSYQMIRVWGNMFTNKRLEGKLKEAAIGCAMAQAVSRRTLTKEARVSPCSIYGGQSGTVAGFSPSYSVFPASFHHGSP
jgi:hypothetical protein